MTKIRALEHGRPHLHLDMERLSIAEAVDALKEWIKNNAIRVLNVAGPRASKDPDIYGVTAAVLESLLGKDRGAI